MSKYSDFIRGRGERNFHNESLSNSKDMKCYSKYCAGKKRTFIDTGKSWVCWTCGNHVKNKNPVELRQLSETNLSPEAAYDLADRAFHNQFRTFGALGWQK